MFLVVKEAAATSGKVRGGCMAPFTTSKKDLGVVTPLVTAERERNSSCQGLLGVSAYF